MEMKKIVFDCDDIMHELNEAICEREGIDINKITDFNVRNVPLLTKEESDTLIRNYQNPDTFRNIKWDPAVQRFDEIQKAGGDIYINSNCINEEIRQLKLYQLMKLGIPRDHIILNHIHDPNSKKSVGSDVYIYVEDSVYNVMHSNAKMNILRKRPWNQTKEALLTIVDKPYIEVSNLDKAIDAILCLLTLAKFAQLE